MRYLETLYTAVLVTTLLFLGTALLTFSPFDRGWGYDDTAFGDLYANQAGCIGAWCASFLFYHWGGAAWIVLFLGYFLIVRLRKGRLDKLSANHCIGLFGCMISLSAYASFLNVDIVGGIMPGGVYGNFLNNALACMGSRQVEEIVLIGFLWIFLVLIVPFDWASLAKIGALCKAFLSSWLAGLRDSYLIGYKLVVNVKRKLMTPLIREEEDIEKWVYEITSTKAILESFVEF